MLIKITHSCSMGCSHCADSCTPDGEHMSWDTLVQSVKKIKEIGSRTILISGGEPTDHPHFLAFAQYILHSFSGEAVVVITSNGLFLNDPARRDAYLSLNCQYQITNDPRYYPVSIPQINHQNLVYETSIRHVVSIGRARENNIEMGPRKGMKCFNLRAMSKQFASFAQAVQLLEMNHISFCVPLIDIDGSIKPGEFTSCKSIGTVWETNDVIYKKLKSMKLNECNACNDIRFLSVDKKISFENL